MRSSRCRPVRLALLFLVLLVPLTFVSGQPPVAKADTAPARLELPAGFASGLHWRGIGPANMSGRIVALAVVEADPSTWWAATSSGGLLKTTNNGVTFEHQFDREATVSIGDVAVAPSNKDVVWVGTGENNPRNSASYGDGVYKSTDGGKTWKNMGLKKTFQIGRIAIHPQNPDVVYVGALGRLWGENEERGLYKTTDGGKTWNKVLHVDDRTGVIEVRMHPRDPETLLVASYERARDGHDMNDPAKKWGAGSALYRTTDGGKTFKKVTKGLPTCKLGRIGIDWYRNDPGVVFAIVESEKIGSAGEGAPPVAARPYMGITGKDGEKGAELLTVSRDGPADKAGLKAGDVITGVGEKAVGTYKDLTDQIGEHKIGDKVKVAFRREGENKTVEMTLTPRPAGGPGGDKPHLDRLGGQAANVQDRQGKEGHQYGGVYRSADSGETWTRINSINPRPMYFSQIRVDPSDEKNLYVLGVSQSRSNDGGKTFRPDAGRSVHADGHALWIDPRDSRHAIIGTDGGVYVTWDRMDNWDHLNTLAIAQFYHVSVDPRRPYRVYGGLQDNGTWAGPGFTKGATGPINEDWISVGGGDGFTCYADPTDPDLVYFTSQYGGLARRHLKTRENARLRPKQQQGVTYRFNWNTPFMLSHHNPKVYYAAGNYVFRSETRGDDLTAISQDITRTKQGSASALAESRKDPKTLWVGTDDGLLWVTRDGGKEWTDVTKNVGLPGFRWVNSIEPSRYVEGRVYVVFDGHRSNDDSPYVYVTEDHGKTWKSLKANLPEWGTTRVLREDQENPNLLYLGTEFAVWASLDRGQSWQKINGNLPTVAIHEIAQHPSTGEIVAATHGRSIWALDVTALRQTTPEVMKEKAHLYKPTTAMRWAAEPTRGRTNRRYVGENPPPAQVYFNLTEKPEKVELKVVDGDGKAVRELRVEARAGLQRVAWDLTRTARTQPGQPGQPRPQPGQRPGGGGGSVAAGTYRVVLMVDGKEAGQQLLKVENDPTAPGGVVAEDEPEDDEEERDWIDD